MPSNSPIIEHDYSPLAGEMSATSGQRGPGRSAKGGEGPQLLSHFKELTVLPQNAEELKGLILQLAIQGKLTKTWRESRKLSGQDVEPASVLLEKIKAEKEQLIKEGKIKKEKPLPVITEDEIAFGLPEGWSWCYMNDIGSTNVGLTYKPAHISEDGVPVLRSSNIQNGEIVLEDLVRVNTDYREKDIIEEGDLLICARNGSRKLVGKCAILGPQVETMVFGAFMAIFRCKYNNYVRLFIQSPLFRSRLEGVETTTINQITQGNLKSTLIPFPPLEEQKAIVSIVNQLFAEVAQLEAATKARVRLKEDYVTSALRQLTGGNTAREWAVLQPHFKSFFTETQNIKTLRESILQLAVQGKLTRKWREEHGPCLPPGGASASGGRGGIEHAADLLARIKAEKAQLIKDKKIKKEKPLPAITEDEIPYELPEGWVWCRFQDVIMDIEAGKSPRCYPEKAGDNEWGVIKMSAISWGTFNAHENKALPIDEEIFEDKEIKPGDFILTRANTSELIAKSVIVQSDVRPKLLLNDKTLRFRFFDSVDIEYLNLYNNGSQAREHYKEVSSGTSDSMQNISRENIKSLFVPLPPLEEQKAIVQQVNALMALCDQLENEIETRTTTLEDWMKSWVGGLVISRLYKDE